MTAGAACPMSSQWCGVSLRWCSTAEPTCHLICCRTDDPHNALVSALCYSGSLLFSLAKRCSGSYQVCPGETSLTCAEFASSVEVNYSSVLHSCTKKASCKASISCDLMVIQWCCSERTSAMREVISSQFDIWNKKNFFVLSDSDSAILMNS